MSDERDTGFKVSDRRKFNPDGTPKDPATVDEAPAIEEPRTPPRAEPPVQEEPPGSSGNILSFPGETARKKDAEPGAEVIGGGASPQASQRQSANAGAARAYDQASTAKQSRLPPASFLGLANMLGVEAAMHLGLIEAGPGEDKTIDLDAARHVIDLLGILQEKTRGNLAPEENTLLDNMLADLRMQFVAASGRR
jgi:hypothetical protein